MPFGDYETFEQCVQDNQDKDSPEGFCAWLHYQSTGEWPSEVDTPDGKKKITHIPDSKNVQVVEKEDGDHLSTPISSLSEDRDGDQFSMDGLKSMAQQINESVNGVPLYEDHGGSTGDYPASEMRGKFEKAEIEDGKLMGDVKFDSEDEQAEWIKGKIERGLPIGFSVGFTPTSKRKKKDTDGQIFDEVDLLEVSAVGIPSNQDAINHLNYDVKSIDKLAKTVKEKLEKGEKNTMSEEDEEKEEEETTDDKLSKDDVREIVREELKDALEEDEKDEEETEDKQDYDREKLEEMIREIVQEELGKEEDEDEDEEDEEEEESKDEEESESSESEPKGASSPQPEGEGEMETKGIKSPSEVM